MRASLISTLLFGASFIVAAASLPAQTAADKTAAEIATSAGPSVVFVKTSDAKGAQIGVASGFIVDPAGAVVTNFHVVAGASVVEVELQNGEIFDAVGVISFDARRDLALVKIRRNRLPALRLGATDALKQGQHIVAVTNPLGFERTLSEGIISAIRVVEGTRYLQFSAPASPGSSGGPLMNLQGEVVGVITKGVAEPGAQNLNFAVPVDYLEPILGQEAKYTLADLAREYSRVTPEKAPAIPAVPPKEPPGQEFVVWHDHGDGFLSFCMGTLVVSESVIVFRTTQSSHSFETPLEGVEEVRKNDVYASDRDAFHIRLRNQENYNFAYAPSGQAVNSDPVLAAVYKVMSKVPRR